MEVVDKRSGVVLVEEVELEILPKAKYFARGYLMETPTRSELLNAIEALAGHIDKFQKLQERCFGDEDDHEKEGGEGGDDEGVEEGEEDGERRMLSGSWFPSSFRGWYLRGAHQRFL